MFYIVLQLYVKNILVGNCGFEWISRTNRKFRIQGIKRPKWCPRFTRTNITGLWKGVLKLGHKSLFCNYLYFNHIFWNNRIIRGCQGFQYFSRLPVLHYLQAVLFIKIWTIFMDILYSETETCLNRKPA
jgi:hypothetical protein